MSEETIRTIFVVQDLEAYRNFYSDEWARNLDATTRPARKLNALALDLLMEWRAAAYAVSLPATIPEHLKHFHDGFVEGDGANITIMRLARGVTAKLRQRIPEIIADTMLIPRIQEEIVNIAAQLEELNQTIKVEFPLEEARSQFLGNRAYLIGLWGSQQVAYASIYNSYESFISQVVGVAAGIESCQSNSKPFRQHLKTHFADELKTKCWNNGELNIAREGRNSLTHAGGRITNDLKNLNPKHSFKVVENRIQITPEKTKELFSLLTKCVDLLCEKALSMPQFR